MPAYYNEIDPFAAAWLRELIAGGHIAPGDVDERSIADVSPNDLVEYAQCHFFAGIGGWSLALRLAGVPDDARVWTGSCPCQPFSVAGLGRGTDDERHLWPEFRRLIAERAPPVVFGEQVASGAGRNWLAAVRADLEDLAYGVGAADLCAAGVGAPHIRQRLWWGAVRVDDTASEGRRWRESLGDWRHPQPGGHGAAGVLGSEGGGSAHGGWAAADWLGCRDGKWRPVEPGSSPLAHDVPARVGRLRGYGNAIVPPVAAAFVSSFLDSV